MDAVPFAQLTAQVDAATASDDPLSRLDAAVTVAAAVAAQADTLIDFYVTAARDAGWSWTAIGDRLGVSRQGARQRFTTSRPNVILPAEVSLRPRLRACLDRATELASTTGAPEVGAEHVLAGLLTDGVAATILDRLGVTADAITAASGRLFGPPAPPGAVPPALSTEVVSAIENAAQRANVEAGGGGLVTVGTAQLLAVVALDHGSRAHRILRDLNVDIALLKKELACYVTVNPPGPAPRRLRRRQRKIP